MRPKPITCPETEEPCHNPHCKIGHCRLQPFEGFEQYGIPYEDIDKLKKQYPKGKYK
jgi:hypothetical protein